MDIQSNQFNEADYAHDIEITILDDNLNELSLLEHYGSLIWTDRYQTGGDFQIDLGIAQDSIVVDSSGDVSILNSFKKDYYVRSNQTDRLMIIEHIETKYDDDSSDNLIVKGRSIEYILDRRVVYGQCILKGKLHSEIKRIINENIISPTDVNRKISNFIFVDSENASILDMDVDTQFTGDSLYTIIENVCKDKKIGFKVTYDKPNKQFNFQLYVGEDRTVAKQGIDIVNFSNEMDNVFETSFLTATTNYKNVMVVGGEGEGSAKKIEVVGTETGMKRREYFMDQSNISSTTDSGTLTDAQYREQLKSKGTEELKNHKVHELFDCVLDHTKTYEYNLDYMIGDKVRVSDIYGNESTSIITEVILSHDNTGFSIYPTFETYEEDEETGG